MRAWVAVVALAGLLAGCVSPGKLGCDAEQPPTLRTPMVDGSYLRTDPSQPWDTVVLQAGPGADPVPEAKPSGWSASAERISPWEDDNFSLLHVTPGSGMGRLDLSYRLDACGGSTTGTLSWDLAAPLPGKTASPGQGVHVYAAGFWENGTLFYTNIKAIDRADWPRAGWYSWEGSDPLPVYVYDRDRGEQPMVWKDPQAGTPIDGTVPGLGYYTTIPGFNDALKGLSTNTVHVVRLAPEQAYTRAGNEEHPLYGDALVFYIKVVDVVDVPCPLEAARLCGAVSQPSMQGTP
jgi:hypothetical protein